MSTAIPSISKNEEANIRLRRLNSATSSTASINTQLPAYASTDSLPSNPFLTSRELNDSDSDNNSISTSDALPSCKAHAQFKPTTILHVAAQGKKAISLPVPTKELEIAILDEGKNTVRYLSQREKRSSGNCVLVSGEDAAATPLTETRYKFGPGQPPIVRILKNGGEEAEEEITLESRSLVHRTVNFESKKWGPFEWRYAGRKERAAFATSVDGKTKGVVPNNVLLLEKIIPNSTGNGGEERILVARLVRSEVTRTPGTRSCAAGNGGQLELCLWRREEGDEKEKMLIDEATVLTTVLSMLKKEIDRLRFIQIMILSGAAGN